MTTHLTNKQSGEHISFTSNIQFYAFKDAVYESAGSISNIVIDEKTIQITSSYPWPTPSPNTKSTPIGTVITGTSGTIGDNLIALAPYTLKDSTHGIYNVSYEINVSVPKQNFASGTTVNQWVFSDELGDYIFHYLNDWEILVGYGHIYLIVPYNDQYYTYQLSKENVGGFFGIKPLVTLDQSTILKTTTNPSPLDTLTEYGVGRLGDMKFIVGGKDSNGDPVDTIYYYYSNNDLAVTTDNQWVLADAKLSTPVANPTVSSIDSLNYPLIVFGGETTGGKLVNDFNFFNLNWNTIPGSTNTPSATSPLDPTSNVGSYVVSGVTLPASKGGKITFIWYNSYRYALILGVNTGTQITDTIYAVNIDENDQADLDPTDYVLSFYTIDAKLPYTKDFVVGNWIVNDYNFTLFTVGEVNGVMTANFLSPVPQSGVLTKLTGSFTSIEIPNGPPSIGPSSDLKLWLVPTYSNSQAQDATGPSGEETTPFTTSLEIYFLINGIEDSSGSYSTYISRINMASTLTYNDLVSGTYQSLDFSFVGGWSKVVTSLPITTNKVIWVPNLNGTYYPPYSATDPTAMVRYYPGLLYTYSAKEQNIVNISAAMAYFYTPNGGNSLVYALNNQTPNPFDNPPTNYYLLSPPMIKNRVTDNSLPISDIDILNEVLGTSTGKLVTNSYACDKPDVFESLLEIKEGDNPTFTLKYISQPNNGGTRFAVNLLKLLAAEYGGEGPPSLSMASYPANKIYTYLYGFTPGLTINSINPKIFSSPQAIYQV